MDTTTPLATHALLDRIKIPSSAVLNDRRRHVGRLFPIRTIDSTDPISLRAGLPIISTELRRS